MTTTQTQTHIGERTGIDFSKHEVLVTQNEFVNIWHLKKPNTSTNSIIFINTNGILAVTGDYGNWIFCREFHPSERGFVESGYWKEKLCILSSQEPMEYDAEGTARELQAQLNGGLVEYGYKGEQLEEMISYTKTCLENVDDEYDYIHYAHREGMPHFLDHESVILVKKTKYWLLAVFDAFDQICTRLKNQPT